MADTLALKRRMRLREIAKNKSVITINRVTRIRAGSGSFVPQPDTTAGPYECRLVQRRMTMQNFAPADSTGDELRTGRYLMMFDWRADVRSGSDDSGDQIDVDEFDLVPFGHFRIMEVVPETDRGGVFGYTAELRKSE